MKIIYPYNEILPLKKAHDAYIVRNCASLAREGHKVTLLIGRGSLAKKQLFEFYGIESDNPLNIVQLPILRRQYKLRLQCNLIFFWFAQRWIAKLKPDCVICSVLKQADFHLSRKIPGCRYLYEVHQIQWYPTHKAPIASKKLKWERHIFDRCDLLTVTTKALKKILSAPPYELKPPIEKVPLACDFEPLTQKRECSGPLQLFYVGQLYASQGVEKLLNAVREVENIHLHVVGGKATEIEYFKKLSHELEIEYRVTFRGFHPTKDLPEILKEADAFITTFENEERMPYVAHTKLYEYQAWSRPIIAPNFEVVQEHLNQGALFYEVDQPKSLADALQKIQDPSIYRGLLEGIQKSHPLTWKKRGCLFNELLNNIQRVQK